MSKEKNGESRKKQAKKTLEMPSIDLLEGELKQTQYKTRYGRVLRSTIFSLLVVAAVAVIIAVLLMPVLQISGNSMEDTLSDGDLVIALNNGKFKTGEVIGFYFNNGISERSFYSGGIWSSGGNAGLFYSNGNNPRSNVNTNIGFRAAHALLSR